MSSAHIRFQHDLDAESVAPDVIARPVSDSPSPAAQREQTASETPATETHIAPPAKRRSSSTTDTASSESSDLDKKATRTPSSDSTTHGFHPMRSVADRCRRKLHLDSVQTSGPSDFFHPTKIRAVIRWRRNNDNDNDEDTKEHGTDSDADDADERALFWNSRDNRKGRNSISVSKHSLYRPKPLAARIAARLKVLGWSIVKMLTSFNYWDMSWWSGWSYSWGSVLFVLDGSWAFTAVAFPETGLPEGFDTYAGPLCFFIGALLYEVGAVMAYLEAVNDGSFQGSAMRRFLEGNDDDAKRMVDERIHSFFRRIAARRHRRGGKHGDVEGAGEDYFPPGDVAAMPRRGAIDLGAADESSTTTYLTWRWWPTWRTLRTHHVYEIGYWACAVQLVGATLYAICGVVVLPGVLSSLNHTQKEFAYWIPQIVASVCFLTAGILFMLETQEKLWRPEPTVVGWWVGFWSIVGSMGFLLCAIFGAASYDVSWGEYQSDLSSSWGSFAYLLCGLFQWYEAVNKRPVEELFNEPGPMKSFQVHAI